MNGLTTAMETETRTEAPAIVRTCNACGATTAPDGTCLEIGACSRADSAASRASRAGATAKFAVPAAWNAGGRVD